MLVAIAFLGRQGVGPEWQEVGVCDEVYGAKKKCSFLTLFFFTIFFVCFRLKFCFCSFIVQPLVPGKEYEENENFHMIRATLFLGS